MRGVREMPVKWVAPGETALPDRAKLFTHGGSQAVRLPKAFRFEGTEVSVRKEGDAVILEPVRHRFKDRDWDAFWAKIDEGKTGNPEDEFPTLEEIRSALLPDREINLNGDG